jgi:hypothetical protein
MSRATILQYKQLANYLKYKMNRLMMAKQVDSKYMLHSTTPPTSSVK